MFVASVVFLAFALPLTGTVAPLHADSGDPRQVGLAAFSVVDTLHGDTIRAAVYDPTTDAERDACLALQSLYVVPGGRYWRSANARTLVVVSHGTGGDEYGHWDSAEALARAGFIVAAIRHPGDDSRGHSGLGTDRYLYGRPERAEDAPIRTSGRSPRLHLTLTS